VPVGTYTRTGTASPLPAGTMLLGFPGQQQTLVDLYYNQYRDYDPTTGRYIQADPIGLAGDENP
jgi:RHS repeat-associated protein